MASDKYSVSVYPKAQDKLAAHVRFLSKVSVPAARHLKAAYDKTVEFLESSPDSCPIYYSHKLSNPNLHYELFSKRYRIVFEIVDNAVYIYDIQDCRQDTDKNLV
jgi:mRNA-degrading endonuclease RelE of RelBE toxin-antitoxin system